jgi:hypothetical protein
VMLSAMLGGHDPRSPFVRLMLIVCVITGRRPRDYLPPDEPTAGNEASRGATRHPQSRKVTAYRSAGDPDVFRLTYWRRHAQRLLRAGNAGIAQIAAHVGYQTGPAVSRAFKRWAGIAPGACRRGR